MNTSSDEGEDTTFARQCRKPIKWGRLCMADTQMLWRVQWPHESLYMADGKTAEYEALSILLLVAGYIRIT